jgi:hypothetical protein
MFLNVCFSFIFYYCFSNYIKRNIVSCPQVINSLNILVNSSIISISTTLYLTNSITEYIFINVLYLSIGYYINELLFNYLYYYNRKQLIIKSIHHFIGIMGILLFYNYKSIIALLFQTEISNIPFEIRNLLKNKDYPTSKTICISVFYFLFLYLRIIKGYYLVIEVCERNIPGDCLLVNSIYILWWYWFVLINYKVFVRLCNLYIMFINH